MEPNREAFSRFQQGDAILTGIAPARELLTALSQGMVLTHAGPPIAFDRMCSPMRGALAGAAIFEGWADSPAEAMALLASGEVEMLPERPRRQRLPHGRRDFAVDDGVLDYQPHVW